jgi:serine/threonine protein kinase
MTFVGTMMYLSPERILGQEYDSLADQWSLGLTMVEIATGNKPVPVVVPPLPVVKVRSPEDPRPARSEPTRMAPFAIIQGLLDSPAPELPRGPGFNFSAGLDQFCRLLLNKTAAERPTFKEGLQNPWVQLADTLPIEKVAAFFKATLRAPRVPSGGEGSGGDGGTGGGGGGGAEASSSGSGSRGGGSPLKGKRGSGTLERPKSTASSAGTPTRNRSGSSLCETLQLSGTVDPLSPASADGDDARAISPYAVARQVSSSSLSSPHRTPRGSPAPQRADIGRLAADMQRAASPSTAANHAG